MKWNINEWKYRCPVKERKKESIWEHFVWIFVQCFIGRMTLPAMKTEPFDCQCAAWILNVLLEGLDFHFTFVRVCSETFLFFFSFYYIALMGELSLCNHCAFVTGILKAASQYFIFFFAWVCCGYAFLVTLTIFTWLHLLLYVVPSTKILERQNVNLE